tara:strand:- start:972 stop:1580 length:609 start_codon:yes stop_codon:yes gene_type:complete
MKYEEFLGKRRSTFKKTFELCKEIFDTRGELNIVELGTTRSFRQQIFTTDIEHYDEDPSVWDWGAGCFTKVFADNLPQATIYSVDPLPEAIFVARKMCENNPNVILYESTAEVFLESLPKPNQIDLLYMDHLESGEEACLEHLKDVKYALENDLLSKESLILHDDVNTPEGDSKSTYSIPYLKKHGYREIMVEYQSLMYKND